ncbi:MAG: molybdopterin molybdotransferase MoeA, partial [bacterium]
LESVSSGKHVAPKSEIMQANSRVISKGHYLSSAAIGVLATVGKVEVKVCQRPTVGILVTGDELVEVHQKPKPGQIRNSNGYVLYHQVRECGAVPELFGIAPDDLNKLRNKIQQGLKKDVLLISGGVSMGDLDLVDDVFEQLGVKIFYNKVDIKPGKPTVFGRKDNTLIFGLPGNPVSASTVFEIFVKPAIRKMMGFHQYHNMKLKAVLEKKITSRTKRQYFPPAWTYFENNTFFTTPLPSKGSADVLAFANSNSYLNIPGEVDEIKKGQGVEVLLRDEFWPTCLNKKA